MALAAISTANTAPFAIVFFVLISLFIIGRIEALAVNRLPRYHFSGMILTRRDFARIALASIPAAAALAAPDSKIDGVQIGAISYSFRDLPPAQIIPAMLKIGLSEVELMSNHAEALAGAPIVAGGRAQTSAPEMRAAQQALREWRAAAKPDQFAPVRKMFTDAGIDLRILCYNMGVNIADDEIDYAFRMARALGAKAISSSSTVTVAKRVAPIADRYKLPWGAHGHDNIEDPEQFATPEVFSKVMALGEYMWVNLDIGHFTAAGFDAVAYIKENHARITNLHLKDRKKSPVGQQTPIQNNNYPWGQGETPIKEVLQLLKKEKYNIPANIEYEYNARATADTVTEVARCFDYAKKALQG
jgi:sugar phosphate isomerase/epimerase